MFRYEAKNLRTTFWQPDFSIWRLKKKIQSPLSACIEQLISDPGTSASTKKKSNDLAIIRNMPRELLSSSTKNLSKYQATVCVLDGNFEHITMIAALKIH